MDAASRPIKALELRSLLACCLAILLSFEGIRSAFPQENDKAQANSHDDAWEAAWIAHSLAVFRSVGKTQGMVIHVGDSISHANPYSQWPRRGSGKTAEDQAVLEGSLANRSWPTTGNDAGEVNGWYLAAADTSGIRGMTASSGIDAGEYLKGQGNGGADMPSISGETAAMAAVADGSGFTGNLHIETVAAAFSKAQLAVLMLGTNDVTANRHVADFILDLSAIVDVLEARNIVVIASTIPPHPAQAALAEEYNDEIRRLAMERGLPLIDFHAEILARRPGTTWNGTLLGPNDVHPSAKVGAYTSSSDPYADGGDPALHRTGEACRNVGYLLRSWLTVQKLKEVRAALESIAAGRALPGDCNGDGDIDVSDAVCLLEALFAARARKLPCGDGDFESSSNRTLLDTDGSGDVDLTDAILLLRHLFLGGPGHVLGDACEAWEGCQGVCGV